MKLFAFFIASQLVCYTAYAADVSRGEAIETAEAYIRFEWTPSKRNVAHKTDSSGVRVDTPDSSYHPLDTRPGWWVPNHKNFGIPYMWGGFSSLEEFAQGIKDGKFAGDIYTAQKRQSLDAAVSKEAVGIDCSGLISRCWRLERSYSTRELPSICILLNSFDRLKPGDILNSHNNHVLLFRSFKDSDHTRIFGYEAGSPPTWKVLCNDIPVSMLKELGYLPYRFAKIHD